MNLTPYVSQRYPLPVGPAWRGPNKISVIATLTYEEFSRQTSSTFLVHFPISSSSLFLFPSNGQALEDFTFCYTLFDLFVRAHPESCSYPQVDLELDSFSNI